MGGEQIIYVSSSDGGDIFENNTIDRFTNRLNTPLILNSHVQYEVGLTSILYPNNYYAILKKSEKYTISVTTTHKGFAENDRNYFYKFECNRNIVAGDIKHITEMLNTDFVNEMKVYLGNRFDKCIKNDTVIEWDEKQKKVKLNYVKSSGIESGEVSKIVLQISPDICKILGISENISYEIYGSAKEEYTMNRFPPMPLCGVEYIYVYSDIVQPSVFGSTLVNILDCFSFQSGTTKGIHNTIYKSLNTNFIEDISIIITDQDGRRINFYEGASVTCVLHIRPK